MTDNRYGLTPEEYKQAFAQAISGEDSKPKGYTTKDGIIYPLSDVKKDLPSLNPISAYELDAMEIKPIEWILENLIAKGNVIIFGAPSKYFKSYMVLGMMAAISEGKSYLGFKSTQCECLYCDLESNKRRASARANQILGEDTEKPKGLYIITGSDNDVRPLGKGFKEQLCDVLDKNPGIGLVAIDVFGKIRTSKGKLDQYEYDYKDISALKAIANEYDIAILLVHHTTKMKRSDPFDDITGSVGLVGAVDCAWTITKDNRAATEGVFHVTGRDIDTMEIPVRFNKDTFTWERLGTPEENAYKQLLEDYDKSNVVKTLFALMAIPGRWEGSVEDIIKASYTNNTPIGMDARTVGLEIMRFKDLLEIEGITFTKIRISKGMRYSFYREEINY